MGSLKWDADYFRAMEPILNTEPPLMNDALTIRAVNDINMSAVAANFKGSVIESVKEDIFEIISVDGTSIALHRLTPPTFKDPSPQNGQPALLEVYGGGLVSGSPTIWSPILRQLAGDAGVTIYVVNHRVAPENPYPKPIEDVYAALEWMRDHASEQGIDSKRIGIMGHSSGAGLVASAALKARDNGFSPPLAKQILFAPMLDDRTFLDDKHPKAKFLGLFWTSQLNKIAWDSYLGGPERKNVSPYAVPARADSLTGLPDTYIAVGGLDLFTQESMEYARRLEDAGVPVEFHLYPGVPHGYSLACPSIPISLRSYENKKRALGSF